MEAKVNAIVLKSVDYKDNDKILTLYSVEKGKITANIRGVKKSGAKLKFASEPFAFCEYVLAEKAGRYTVIGASYIDNFFNLRLNLTKYYVSAVILDGVNFLVGENEVEDGLFSLVINAVKLINYKQNEINTLIGFLLEFCKILGYEIRNLNCQDCDCPIDGRVFFSVKNAEFYCESCRKDDAFEITFETYVSLMKIYGKSLEDVQKEEISFISTLKTLKFLFFYIKNKTDTELKSFSSLIDYVQTLI